jgi:hypothetical protein
LLTRPDPEPVARYLGANGETQSICLPAPARGFPGFYLFGLHKGGSTLMNKLVADACQRAGVPTASIPDTVFLGGGRIWDLEMLAGKDRLNRPGCGMLGWRAFPPPQMTLDVDAVKSILLVRDPRDRLVSNYFSVAYSHVVPEGGWVHDIITEGRRRALAVEDANEWIRSQSAQLSWGQGSPESISPQPVGENNPRLPLRRRHLPQGGLAAGYA